MPKEGELRIKSKRKEKFIHVEFTDTGKGIPQEVIGKIFDPLFTSKAKGIDLGLAISKEIIKAHKGEIKVKSEEGKRTTFTVILPIGGE
jgi:signal transduction histidine kinase